MRLRLLYFGVLRDLLSSPGEEVEVQAGATVGEILSLSAERASNLREVAGGRAPGNGIWASVAVAVNREYAGPGTVLREGDEVALLPPVSGGRR